MIAHFSRNFVLSFILELPFFSCTAFVSLLQQLRSPTLALSPPKKRNHENENEEFPHVNTLASLTTETTWNWFWLYRWWFFLSLLTRLRRRTYKKYLRAFSMETRKISWLRARNDNEKHFRRLIPTDEWKPVSVKISRCSQFPRSAEMKAPWRHRFERANASRNVKRSSWVDGVFSLLVIACRMRLESNT